jgi:formyltetrahydrofolate deformylase
MTTSLVHARILISCKDRPGIVAKVSSILFALGANITESAQHSTDPFMGHFFMRIAFYLPVDTASETVILQAFHTTIQEWEMDFHYAPAHVKKRMAIFVSKEDHCLQEILWQHRAGALDGEIAMIVSNHPDHGDTAANLSIPFYHTPITKESRAKTEALQLELVKNQTDLIVLARYMQILSPEFIDTYHLPIINIHHSFLPAFVGAKPYERAFERGVKIIGATAHYVTSDLDAGPIIEQDVQRIDHGYTAADMKKVGREIERQVLTRAIHWHLEDRILRYGNKTIIFR